MIIFRPTYSMKQATSINFDVLGEVFNQLFIQTTGYEKSQVITLGVGRSTSWTYMNCEHKIIIARYACQSRDEFFINLIHEFRHWIQRTHFKDRRIDSTKYKSWEEYYNSPEEIDARKYEKICNLVIALYDNLCKLKQTINEEELYYYNQDV